jgi:hypothetical protein
MTWHGKIALVDGKAQVDVYRPSYFAGRFSPAAPKLPPRRPRRTTKGEET